MPLLKNVCTSKFMDRVGPWRAWQGFFLLILGNEAAELGYQGALPMSSVPLNGMVP